MLDDPVDVDCMKGRRRCRPSRADGVDAVKRFADLAFGRLQFREWDVPHAVRSSSERIRVAGETGVRAGGMRASDEVNNGSNRFHGNARSMPRWSTRKWSKSCFWETKLTPIENLFLNW